MAEQNLHAHAQIEYTRFDRELREDALRGNRYPDTGEQAESLFGFDPTSGQGRAQVHRILDEYLDYLARFHKFRQGQGVENYKSYSENTANRFIVFGHLDT